MEKEGKFRTQKGYDLTNKPPITRAMEDYLEMVYRLSKTEGVIRITALAEKLNVRASSASKMVSHLKQAGLVTFEKYGVVALTREGKELGEYLLHRHTVLHQFFCLINHSENELEQVEQIEHFITKETISNIEVLLSKSEIWQKTEI